jgi:hypothetical protein
MNPRRHLGAAATAAAVALLALPGTAGAVAGKRSFAQTFPVASRLCTNIAQGKGPARLRSSAARVIADCSALQGSYNAARANVLATQAALAAQGASARAGLASPCTGAAKHRLACEKAHNQDRRVLGGLNRQRVKAAHAYYLTIESARVAFWKSIRALPGGAGLREDARIRVEDS